MKKILIILGIITLLLFSGCGTKSYISVIKKNDLDNIHYNNCETTKGEKILCSKTCTLEKTYMVCTLDQDPIGQTFCRC